MNEEERQIFFEGLPKELIWKMAEGNPDNKTQLDGTIQTNSIPLPPEAIALIEEDTRKRKLNEL